MKNETSNLVYVELINGITNEMREDAVAHIISDGGCFLVTTVENAGRYPHLLFRETDANTLAEYHKEYEELVRKFNI